MMNAVNFDYATYAALTAHVESGATGYGLGYHATNKTSTAYGRYQLINAVFTDFLGKIDHSELAQEKAMYGLTMQNVQALINRKMPVTFLTVYCLHNLGKNGGIDKIKRGLTDSYFALIASRLDKAKEVLGVEK